MNHQPSTKRTAFTLIELLVVVAIIGVLFAVALPIFENAGRKDTSRAAYQLMTTMRLARQHAIKHRQWTIVIFPNADGAYSGQQGDTVDKCLRSYAVIAASNNLDGEYKFDPALRDPRISDMRLTFVSDWKYLPAGIYLDDGKMDTSPGNYLFNRDNNGIGYAGVFKFPIDPANPNTLVRPMGAVLFRPNGRAYIMSDASSTGKYWQDKDASKIYITSAKYYEPSGGALGAPQIIPGTSTVVQVRNKTGQVQIED